ncbi:ras family-domain-containing protein [Histomonas meleagridis]|uniref:ras family-domain-containing protein n=1 Tax=Histomonas meleagridis TaxID=135588 RepID=UPI00355A2B6E|nr:ras family-domain-containing protein [Histomonas meleagridis]KAH0801468.1 ras family-domain-containing protein [Histomonas meleagridis]
MKTKNSIKVLIVGNASVGKTAILNRFIDDKFEQQNATVCINYLSKVIELPNHESVKLQIWDTAGSETYKSLAPMYYRDADLAILTFAVGDINPESLISSRESFEDIDLWHKEIMEFNKKTLFCICGNMSDIPEEQREITTEEGRDKAMSYNVDYFETSAKTGNGINELFTTMAQKCLERMEVEREAQQEPSPKPVPNETPKRGFFSWLFSC